MSVREMSGATGERALRDEIEMLDVQVQQARRELQAHRDEIGPEAHVASLQAALVTCKVVHDELTILLDEARDAAKRRRLEHNELEKELRIQRSRLAKVQPTPIFRIGWPQALAVFLVLDGMMVFLTVGRPGFPFAGIGAAIALAIVLVLTAFGDHHRR